MSAPHLVTEAKDGILWLRLNRPEKRNALSPELMVQLAETWQTFRADAGLRVAILIGSGERQFCAGADLQLTIPLLAGNREPENHWDRRLRDAPELAMAGVLYDSVLDKPIISALNGDALGGGAELMLSTDIRVACAGVRIGFPEPKRGLVPGGGGVTRLARQIGYAPAMELLLTAEPISAERALELGLINSVVPRDELEATALAIAQQISQNAPLAVRAIKETVRRTAALPLDEARALETQILRPVASSQDAREGARAFVEKRKPNFVGK